MTHNTIILRCNSCKTLNRIPEDRLSNHPICGKCKTPLGFPRVPINVTTENFDRQINDWPEIVLAEFWAKWCGYCRSIEPFINDLASRRSGRLKIVRVDVDEEQSLARRFMIRATPTFILFRNGKQLARFDGAPAKSSELESWLDRTMLQSAYQP